MHYILTLEAYNCSGFKLRNSEEIIKLLEILITFIVIMIRNPNYFHCYYD